LVGHSGAIQPDIHGPQRNDPAEGTPAHAYSPFDERRNREYPCPPGGCEFQKGQVVVKLAPQVRLRGPNLKGAWTEDATLNEALQAQGVLRLELIFPNARAPKPGEFVVSPQGERLPKPDLTRWYRAALADEKTDVYAVVEALNANPSVDYAEPDYLRRPVGGPAERASSRPETGLLTLPGSSTDPLYDQQWHLSATNVPQAWQWLEDNGYAPGGSRDVVVAVIDTGVDYTHPDLAANMWVNAAEFNGSPGVDDDGNGYVDDICGADTVYPDGDPQDDHGHGTHVAGIIAAQANNGIGGVGVAYNVQLMAIKAAQYSGVLASSDIAEAIYYAVAQGADVINMSFGGYARSQVEEDALAVAFGQAVLVAAAGNDGKVNLPCPFGRDMYPAAYNWVLGVMASTQGGGRALFSNYDCTPRDSHEYELMAPGVDVWSTLPREQYAAWDGTSMATPIVSGIAALLRTKWSDKDVYSSRFIMGQIAANASGGTGGVADAYAALTVAPQPELSYLEHWTFDTAEQSPNNDDDGIVDAGETVDLAIVIRNHWGKADPVTVTLEAWAEGAYQPDPYVTIITGTVDYGAVGSFNVDDNGLIYDDQGVIVGVRHPFRFSVDPDTPNDHVIPFRLTMTARNGLDPADTTVYTFQSRFYLIVQRGRELLRIISQDMVLTKDYYWLVPDQTLIEAGVAVTVTEGTQIQFWSTDPNNPYGLIPKVYIDVRGSLLSNGTTEEPIEFFTGLLYPDKTVKIVGNGNVALIYTKIDKPELTVASIDHSYFSASTAESIPWWVNCVQVNTNSASNSIFHKMFGSNGNWAVGFHIRSQSLVNNLFDRGQVGARHFEGADRWLDPNIMPNETRNNVFLNNWIISGGQLIASTLGFPQLPAGQSSVINNAFLNEWWNPDISHWTWIVASDAPSGANVSGNYWGTNSTTLIESAIYDYNDDFNRGMVVYQPILTNPPETAYPFVVDVILSTAGQSGMSALHGPTPIVGAEVVTFTVTFNCDMDTSVQPAVSFGPDVPMTDYTIHPIQGGWQDPRTWAGTFNITPITGDGYQLMRIADAVAADDPWLVTGDDSERFRFEIITSGTEAMNLQATGGEGYVDLMWTQDDFDLLAGFNLYRSTSQDGIYTRINASIIPPDQRTWRDTNVQPGQPYYYKFTVVKTDMTESDFSNVATATPVDTIPPVISHTPVTQAPPGLPLTLFADVTDNVGVQGVTLYYRAIGATSYQSKAMVKTTGNRYSATIEGAKVTSPGLEYYIEASDGVSTVRDGRPEYPHQVTVVDRPVVTTVSPNHGPASGGTMVTISGSNFKAGASVTFGGAVAEDATVVSSSQMTCTTPAHYPATVDVRVTNPDSQSGTLLRGFTYESGVASLSLPATGGGQHDIVQVPVNAANVQGLAAASLTVAFDSTVLSARDASTGNLTPGWSLAANTSTPGQIRISMASPGGTVTGSGVLAYLEFEVVGSPGASTALQLTSVSLNDGAIPVETADGSFQVNLVYDVAGTVRFWNGGAGVPGVLLTLEGDRVYTGLSDASGVYTVSIAETDDYTLIPSKSNGVNGISAYDASLALQHDAGLTTLSGYAATAGDVNKNGSITSMDAFYILQKAVELITLPFPGAGVVWDFSPSSRSYTNLSSDQTGQDFTAVLLGDVSGNWSAMGGSGGGWGPEIMAMQSTTATLSLPQASVLPSQQVTVPLTLSLPEGELYGADIALSYDTAVVSATTVVKGALATGWSMATNLTTPGVMRVAMAGATPITTSGELLLFVFNAVGSAGSDTDLTLTRGDLNEGGIPADLQHGNLYIARPVQAAFTASPTVGVAPLTVDFTNTSTGDFDTCAWTFGDGGTSADCNDPSHIYNSGGVYTVTLTVSGPGGTDTETKVDYITIYQPPTAQFSGDPTSGPSSLAVSFTNLSTGDFDACAWTFGDGGTSSECNDPGHTYTAAGVYTVTLTVSGLGGSDTETKVEYITVYQPPTAEFSADPTSGPASLAVSFTNLSTGDFDTCAWTFGDGGSSADCNDPGHTYTAAGVYTVTLTVSGLGGSDTETKVEYITVYLLDISGAVRFWQDAAGVPGVLLTLEGDHVYTGTTDTAGAYTVTGVLAGDYTLTPSKSDGVNGITAYDASFVLQHAAGLITLTGHQAIAAEVSNNGGITSMDASYILQKAVDLIALPFPGASVVWDFDPTSRSYTNLSSDQTGQDFTAVLLGDVSGNWSAGVGQALAQLASTASLTLPNLYAEPGERITVTLDIALDQAEVYGADIAVSYDQAVALADSVSAGDAAEGFMTASNLDPPGQVRVAMAGAQPITDDGHLLALVFDVVGELGDASLLQITVAELNESGVTVQRQNGSVSVVDLPDYDFNRDCNVDVVDIMRVASRWRCRRGDGCYDERFDIDHDDDIDIVDIMLVVVHWGETCW
jgi:PKD repeat protein/subtilisin family serine protease